MKYCPTCNKEAEDSMIFCMDCGTRLQNKPENTEKEEQSKRLEIKTDKKSNAQWV